MGARSRYFGTVTDLDGEHALFGASIGVIAGAIRGIVTGITEGQSKREQNVRAIRSAELELRPSLVVARSSDGRRMDALLGGRFSLTTPLTVASWSYVLQT